MHYADQPWFDNPRLLCQDLNKKTIHLVSGQSSEQT